MYRGRGGGRDRVGSATAAATGSYGPRWTAPLTAGPAGYAVVALGAVVATACGKPSAPATVEYSERAPTAAPAPRPPKLTTAPAPRERAKAPQPASRPLAPPGPSGPRYPATRTLSPLTASVAANVRAIAARGPAMRDNVFMKVGASGSAAPWLLSCLAGSDVVLGDFGELGATLAALRAADAGGESPLSRKSLAAAPGKTAAWALRGSPSPLEDEIAAISPRFAFVHYGTNDMHMGATYAMALQPFARNLLTIVDTLSGRGVVASLGTLSPRLDNREADRWVPVYNQVVRAIAQGRQLPLLDMHTAMLALPNQGRGEDLLHANMLRDGDAARPCVFTDRGLRYAYNVRNLLSLRLLHRLRLALSGGSFAPELGDPELKGVGSVEEPLAIDALPFADLRDTRRSRHVAGDGYRCGDRNAARTGPEVVYALSLRQSQRLRVVAVNLSRDVDVDVYLLSGAGPPQCFTHDGQVIEGTLARGDYRIAVETRVEDGAPRWGEFALVVVPCDRDDADCDDERFGPTPE